MDDVMSVCSDHIGLYPGIQWEGGGHVVLVMYKCESHLTSTISFFSLVTH